MKSFSKTAARTIAALFTIALLTMGVASPAFADGATGTVTSTITNARTGKTYDKLADATADAQSNDTILLGEGNYTLYGVSSVGHTKDKNLTFEGLGADKTAWNIGAEVPNPAYYGTEYNGDYSFDGAGTVTFKNMTLRSGGSKDYLGFIRANNTVVDGCVINGKTAYWGYESAVFKNTTFNPPTGDYALWTYCSPTMTFDGCTFNATGKVINVYTDAIGNVNQNITVNVNNCTFNSNGDKDKQALNINDSLMGDHKFILNITGNNTVTAARDNTTCSQLFGFGGKSGNDTGRTDVKIDGVLVWSKKGDTFKGEMKTHDYTGGEHDNAYDVNYTEWASDNAGTWTRKGTPKCRYCGFVKPEFEEKAYDLSYDLNGSEDEQAAEFAPVKRVTEAEVTAEQPVRKGYSFVGWNTAKNGSGTSYAAGVTVELSAPVTLFAQWKKDEPAPKPSDKPADKTKANKQALPKAGDATSNVIAAMGVMAIVCFAASAVVSKVRK